MTPTPGTDLAVCKRCRRTIRFVFLENGKRVPCDPDPVDGNSPDMNTTARLVTFLEQGSYVRGWFRSASDWYPFGAWLFVPHSDTCHKKPERHAPPPDIMAKIRADIAAARAREVQ